MKAKTCLYGLVVGLAGLSAAWSASLHVAPVTVQMSPGQSASTLSLRNDGDKPLRAQVRVFTWTQEQGKDKLEPSSALLASPPMIEVAPQATQTIRLVRAIKSTVTVEESYRVLVDEIADPASADLNGVNVQLRYSVPVFVAPNGMQPARTTVTAVLDGSTLSLKVQNLGGQHANLSAVSITTAGGDAVMLEPGLLGYALAGQTMQWQLNLPADAAKTHFASMRCRINGAEFSAAL